MTIPYSVTIIGIKEQLASQLTKTPRKLKKNVIQEFIYSNITYNLTDLILLATKNYNSIYEVYPRLRN